MPEEGAEVAGAVDWSGFGPVAETLTCACGTSWRSHSKFVHPYGAIARRPCPSCGSHLRVRSSRGDPEVYSL